MLKDVWYLLEEEISFLIEATSVLGLKKFLRQKADPRHCLLKFLLMKCLSFRCAHQYHQMVYHDPVLK